jgi:hypothetical protein
VAQLTPTQRAIRARFESAIGIAAPFLDVVLGVGERISRITEPTDHEYYPVRAGRQMRLPGESDPGEGDAPAEAERGETG